MLTILATLIPVFGIIFLGFLVQRLGFLPAGTAVCMNQFVYWIGLPALLFNQLARMEAGQVSSWLVGGILLSMAISHLLAYIFYSGGFRKSRKETAIMAMLSSFPNCAFMGLPIVILLLPDNHAAALTASLCAVLTFVVVLFTDCKLEITSGRENRNGGKMLLYVLRSLFHNPLLIASALGACISLFQMKLPMPFNAMTSMLGATASPCALFCMGMILSAQMTSSRGFVPGWFSRQLPIHLFKLVVQPFILYGVLSLCGIQGIALGVSIIVVSMPTGIAAYIIAEKYQIATDDSSLGIVMNTTLSIFTIPVSIALMQFCGIL